MYYSNLYFILHKDFLEEAEKEKKELEESYKESVRQTKERTEKERTTSEKLQDDLEPLPTSPMSDE